MVVVHQNPYVNENDTIRENLQLDGSVSEAKLKETLEMAALGHVDLEAKASCLSGGQVQLLSLAQAMLEPREGSILLLDEPTSHIDAESQ